MPTYATSADVFRYGGIDATVVLEADIDEFIDDAEQWVDSHFETTFVPAKNVVDVMDGTGTDTLFLNQFPKTFQDALPVLTLNSLTIDGTSITVGEVHVYPERGELVLKDTAEETRFTATKRRQITVDFDYGSATVPRNIRSITAIVAAIHALTQQIGGTFDDVTSYSLPEFTASKGEPFTNIRETITRLNDRLNKLLEDNRPLTNVG